MSRIRVGLFGAFLAAATALGLVVLWPQGYNTGQGMVGCGSVLLPNGPGTTSPICQSMLDNNAALAIALGAVAIALIALVVALRRFRIAAPAWESLGHPEYSPLLANHTVQAPIGSVDSTGT